MRSSVSARREACMWLCRSCKGQKQARRTKLATSAPQSWPRASTLGVVLVLLFRASACWLVVSL
eukprot:1182288-Pleurochrysis_carterae.AAC.2